MMTRIIVTDIDMQTMGPMEISGYPTLEPGYALIEFENFEEAQRAINETDGTELLMQSIGVDWAFSKGPFKRRNVRRRSPRGHRSRSPGRRY
ncbi:unnamed protein product [Ilex paraguariensis]|uniref:RRM domain-containing protein n=1 Tax=Ilex paraguariensis TaxID=185542 RepID=A0ABC8U3U4_9AQUA